MTNGFLGGVIAIFIWNIAMYIKNRNSVMEVEDTSSDDDNAAVHTKTNKDIVTDSLHSLQCEPKIDNDDDGSIIVSFEYQAHNFNIRVESKKAFVTLYDTYWYSFESEDIEQLSAVKRIVNDINWLSQANVCYNTVDDKFYVHTTASLLCGEHGDFTSYLRHILRECFVIHNQFFKQLAEASAASNK